MADEKTPEDDTQGSQASDSNPNKISKKIKQYYLAVGLSVLALVIFVGFLLSAGGEKPVTFKVSGTSPNATALKEGAKPDRLYINFSGSSARLEEVGKVIMDGLKMTPELSGRWEWRADSELLFTPSEDWGVGQKYTVTMDKTLFPDHVKLDKYEYEFTSARFTQRVVSSELYQDPVNPRIKRAVLTVRFSHPVDTVEFAKLVHLRMGGLKKKVFGSKENSIPFTISYDDFKGQAYIKSEPLALPEKDKSLTIAVSHDVKSSRGGTRAGNLIHRSITIPGIYNFFRIRDLKLKLIRNERYDPEQVLIIETTDGVLESEILQNLSVYVLPKDRPAVMGTNKKIKKNFYWRGQEAIIGEEILSISKPVSLEAVPTEQEFSKLHSFRYNAEVGKYLYIKLNKGVESRGGYILPKVFDKIIKVPAFPKELEIMHEGALLSLSGDKKLSILSRGIKAVRFEVSRVLPGDINHLVTQTSGDIKSPHFRNWKFNEDNITERFHEVRTLSDVGPAKAQYTSFDFSKYIKAGKERGIFFFKVEGWNPRYKHTTGEVDKRLVMITNLGILIKDNADKSHEVFIQSLSSGRPVGGATVEVLGKNGVSVAKRKSSTDGHLSFPNFKDFKKEKEPVAYLVRKGKDMSFIPFKRRERQLNLSRFDVGGVRTRGNTDKLNAYLFSERGIYRPGDEFNIGLIVREAKWGKNTKGIPLEAVVKDSRGLTVMSKKFSLSEFGFDEIKYKTDENSPTGNYQISVYIIKHKYRRALLGSTTVKVEEFLPDRMRITSSFSTHRLSGWVEPEGLKGMITLKNLFGTPATDRRVRASITLAPAYPRFSAFKDYNFFDPAKAKRSFTEILKEEKTDDEGKAEFDLGLKRFEKATYRLSFTAEGFEAKGGRGVVTESSVLISPLKYLIGYKTDGNLRYIKKKSERNIEFIAINSTLKKTQVKGVKLKIISKRYVSALTRQPSGLYKYQSVLKERVISTEDFSIDKKGKTYRLPTKEPGDFSVVIEDAKGTELSKVSFSVVGEANLTRDLEKNAELQVKLNKSDFSPGEEIEVSITAPYVGSGLITIERDKVYEFVWFKTGKTSTVKKIRVPKDLEGNGYVNVSFVRALDSKEIFMSPLSYGVAPFTVSKDKHDIKVSLEVDKLVRPGEELSVKYKSSAKGKVAIFIVDEGILQVGRHKTPDPLSHFFQKRALEVETSQILDLLLPEFKLLKELSGVGGGMMDRAKEAVGKNLNPFKRKRLKPVAFWSGIIEVGTKERELLYKVPGYFNGTLRVMAVAVGAKALGATSEKTIVKGHFVLSPNVPTFVAPGDVFTVSLGVANNVEGSGTSPSVSVVLKTSKHLEILGESTKVINIGEGREKALSFKVRATKKLGSGNLKFTAQAGKKKATYSIDLSVRPPVPFMTTVNSGYFKKGPKDATVERVMYPHYRTLEASASTVPLGLASGLLKFIDKFPYGCTEQIVSKAFPAIVLRARPALGYGPEKIEANLARAIHVLQARQNSDGAFGYWAANSHVSDYLTVYAMHFLVEAKERRYSVPENLMKKGLDYLKKIAKNKQGMTASLRTRAYAVYVLTRSGKVTTNYINSMPDYKKQKLSKGGADDLTVLYLAASYKLLKQDKKAKSLIRKLKMRKGIRPDYRNFYDSLARNAQYLYILSRHFPTELENLKAEDILIIADELEKGNYNTISSSFTILAFDAYAEAVGLPSEAGLEISEIFPEGKDKALKGSSFILPRGLFPVVEFRERAEKIRFNGKTENFIFYQTTEAGFDVKLPEQEIKERLEIQREYRNLSGKVIKKIGIGSEIEVHLKVRSVGAKSLDGEGMTEAGKIHNVAVVELLPGGFEVVRDSVRGGSGSTAWRKKEGKTSYKWQPDYVDVREDRIIIFGTIGNDIEEYVYRIKATNKGEFSVPPVYGESMYDRAIKARSPGGRIVVEGK